MYTFKFTYSNNTYKEFKHIQMVEYYNYLKEIVVVNNEEILNHRFPVDCDMYLYSKNSSYTVNKNGLIFISVTKE